MSDLIEFLEARIGEDEEWAQAAAHFGSEKWSASDLGRWEINDDWQPMTEAEAQHIARHDPVRVLAECAAKRELLQLARHIKDNAWQDGELKVVSGFRAQQILRALLLPYTSHPDYDPTWKD